MLTELFIITVDNLPGFVEGTQHYTHGIRNHTQTPLKLYSINHDEILAHIISESKVLLILLVDFVGDNF